ncbi:MAG: sodium:calcium antiporter [Alphaproteobacteria bacterium]
MVALNIIETLSLWQMVGIFCVCAAITAVAGTKLTIIAEELAKISGLGQALVGAVAIGIVTSLSGVIVAFYTAFEGHTAISIATSVGGLPAQTVFLAIADLTYRKVNLEHASASLENLSQSALLFILLSLPLLAFASPQITFYRVHPVTPVLFITYIFGLHIVRQVKKDPMWYPRKTQHTQKEKEGTSKQGDDNSVRTLVINFLTLAFLLTITGLTLAQTAISLSEKTGISETVFGALFTAISTSLPELITTLTAVRRKALNLAVGNIIGGNSFDVLFIAGADIFYREGSLYHRIETAHIGIITASMLMTGFLMLGLLRREKQGPASIGFESFIILGIYIVMTGLLFV